MSNTLIPAPPRKLGWVPDPFDANDHDAVQLLMAKAPATVPISATNEDLVKVIDQGGLGSCTVNGTAQAIRAAEMLELLTAAVAAGADPVTALVQLQLNTPFMSRLWGYFLARAWEGTIHQDAGTFIRLVFASINKYGFPRESTWPYSDNTDPLQGPVLFDKMPSAEAFREAYDQRDNVANRDAGLISYARISATGYGRVDAIKLAVAQRHLIVFGTTVSEKFCSDMSANNGKPINPPVGLKPAGGHAMCVGGYDAAGAKIVNSWSDQYGDRGWCTFSWDYMVWSETTDLWIVKRAPLLQKAA